MSKQRKIFYRKQRISEVGEYLTKLRISQGMTQQKAAESLGISRSYICRIERGNRKASSTKVVSTMRQLAAVYGVAPQEVLLRAGMPEMFNLSNLRAIIAPSSVDISPMEDIKGVTEEEKKELIRYLAFLRLKKDMSTPRQT